MRVAAAAAAARLLNSSRLRSPPPPLLLLLIYQLTDKKQRNNKRRAFLYPEQRVCEIDSAPGCHHAHQQRDADHLRLASGVCALPAGSRRTCSVRHVAASANREPQCDSGPPEMRHFNSVRVLDMEAQSILCDVISGIERDPHTLLLRSMQ